MGEEGVKGAPTERKRGEALNGSGFKQSPAPVISFEVWGQISRGQFQL